MSGPLRNPKHERLAQEKAKGNARAESLTLVGLSPTAGSSVRTWSDPKFNMRVAELQTLALEAHNEQAAAAVRVSDRLVAIEITLEGQIEKAEMLMNKAIASEQIGAAVSALTLQSKLAGFLHEKPAAAGDTFNIAFIKAPPQETFEQFNERRSRQLRLVGTSARSTNGSGRSDMVS